MLKISRALSSQFKMALAEDIGRGDVTSEVLVPRTAKGKAVVTAREAGVFCGEPVARALVKIKDPSLHIRFRTQDGSRIKKNVKILELTGRLRSILAVERTLLNFIGKLSGIATLTRQYADAVKNYPARILDTRKTTPLWRELEKYAVRCGGGENHRFGLWDEILVKDNHWAAIRHLEPFGARHSDPERSEGEESRDPSAASRPQDDASARLLQALRAFAMTKKQRRIPIEIEVRNLKELAHLLEGTFVPDRILLDNFSTRELARAVSFVHHFFRVLRGRYGLRRKRPLLEASGGIDLSNVRAVARTGVDRISVGRLTHSAPSLDFSLTLEKFGLRNLIF